MANNRFKKKADENANNDDVKDIVGSGKAPKIEKDKVKSDDEPVNEVTQEDVPMDDADAVSDDSHKTNKANESRKSFNVKVKKKVKEAEVFSVNLTKDMKKILDGDKVTSGNTVSAIVVEILQDIYDEDTNTFSIPVEPNKEVETQKTTLNLPKNIKKAINDNAKAHNMKAYEYFNKLLEGKLNQ